MGEASAAMAATRGVQKSELMRPLRHVMKLWANGGRLRNLLSVHLACWLSCPFWRPLQPPVGRHRSVFVHGRRVALCAGRRHNNASARSRARIPPLGKKPSCSTRRRHQAISSSSPRARSNPLVSRASKPPPVVLRPSATRLVWCKRHFPLEPCPLPPPNGPTSNLHHPPASRSSAPSSRPRPARRCRRRRRIVRPLSSWRWDSASTRPCVPQEDGPL